MGRKRKINIFFDMDGVLVSYNRKDYKNGATTWLKPGYFKDLKPISNGVDLFLELKTDNNIKPRILTTVTNDDILKKIQYKDKCYWANNNLLHKSDIKDKQPVNATVAGVKKSNKAKIILKRQLTKNDLLIDDYNPNLKEWEAAGGTGVKYINGQNNPSSWNGPKIYKNNTTKENIKILKNLTKNF